MNRENLFIRRLKNAYYTDDDYLSQDILITTPWHRLSTKTCLQASIIKWYAIAQTDDPSVLGMDAASCPLCQKFLEPVPLLQQCNGCPVKKVSGKNYCDNTPYEKVEKVMDLYVMRKPGKLFKKAAMAEAHFLTEIYNEKFGS